MIKLSNIVNNGVVKKTVYDKLLVKVNNIDISGFLIWHREIRLRKENEWCRQKIPDNNELVKKISYIAKISELEGKIPSNTNLATTAALTIVENEIPDVNNLVKKETNYDAEILDLKSKYFTTADYNKFTNKKVDLKMKQKGLVNKSDITGFINNADLDKKKSGNINNKRRAR